MTPSIFTLIINGEVPAYKIYEDNLTIAILDIHPVQPGHILVIPKKQVDHLEDLPNKSYQAVFLTVKNMALRQRRILGCRRVGISVVGVDVPHAHVHLIPFNTVKQLRQIVDTNSEPDLPRLRAMADRLTAIVPKT